MTIFGGFAGPGNPYANDVWVLSGANGLGTPSWKQLLAGGVGAAGTPIGRSGPSCVYDSANNRMIMFGGEANFGGLTSSKETYGYSPMRAALVARLSGFSCSRQALFRLGSGTARSMIRPPTG